MKLAPVEYSNPGGVEKYARNNGFTWLELWISRVEDLDLLKMEAELCRGAEAQGFTEYCLGRIQTDGDVSSNRLILRLSIIAFKPDKKISKKFKPVYTVGIDWA